MTKLTPVIPSPYYRVSLKAIVLNEQRQILVIQMADGSWEMPGGGWEHGESMQHCLRREIMEELGVGIDHINFKRIYPYRALGQHGSWSLKLAVPVTVSSQEFVAGDGAVAWAYVSASEFAKLDMVDAEVGIKTHIDRIWR